LQILRDFLLLKRLGAGDVPPVNYIVGWSNGVDVWASVALYAAFCLLHSAGWLSRAGGAAAAALSLVPKLWRFAAHSDTLSYLRMERLKDYTGFYCIQRQT
jgi:hypothetical protein